MERGSELNPINVAVGAMLGGGDVGGKVGPIKEPPGMKNGGEIEDYEIEDQEVIGDSKGGQQGDIRGWSTSRAGLFFFFFFFGIVFI